MYFAPIFILFNYKTIKKMEKVQNLKKDALIKELKEKRVMELNEKGAAGSSAYQVAPCLAHCFM